MTQPVTRLAKTAPAEHQLPFSPGVWVASIMGRPSDCRCTWVPELGGFALKFRDHDCPARYRHG